MITSLANTAINGKRNDWPLSFTIIPENNAMAITGEKPDQLSSGPKKNLHAVATAIRRMVKPSNLPLIFIADNLLRKYGLIPCEKPILPVCILSICG